jgi:hypothetical protein
MGKAVSIATTRGWTTCNKVEALEQIIVLHLDPVARTTRTRSRQCHCGWRLSVLIFKCRQIKRATDEYYSNSEN